MERIRVLVHGASGRMGREVLAALSHSEIAEPVGAVSRNLAEGFLRLPESTTSIPSSSDLDSLLSRCNPNVLVDFTNAQGAMTAAHAAASHGTHLVIGSTGLEQDNLDEIKNLCKQHRLGVVVAPNFALGAVLLIHLAKQVGRFFPYAEVTEMHHEAKKDAPSGTSLAIASALARGREVPFEHPTPEKEPIPGTMGGVLQGVSLHSIRMPGRLAHHEVLLGTQGRTFSLRHDTINRECYMPGVIAAIRYVMQSTELTVGLDRILGLV